MISPTFSVLHGNSGGIRRSSIRSACPADVTCGPVLQDRGEHGIAPQRLQPRPEFRETPPDAVKRKHPQFHEGAIPGEPVLSLLVQPVR